MEIIRGDEMQYSLGILEFLCTKFGIPQMCLGIDAMILLSGLLVITNSTAKDSSSFGKILTWSTRTRTFSGQVLIDYTLIIILAVPSYVTAIYTCKYIGKLLSVSWSALALFLVCHDRILRIKRRKKVLVKKSKENNLFLDILIACYTIAANIVLIACMVAICVSLYHDFNDKMYVLNNLSVAISNHIWLFGILYYSIFGFWLLILALALFDIYIFIGDIKE